MPHCRLACSRNLFCKVWSTPLVASPSTVAMFLPCASTPSIRHEHTARPSSITVHAPQSPVWHPSFDPVSSSTSRRVSSSLSPPSPSTPPFLPCPFPSSTLFFIPLFPSLS